MFNYNGGPSGTPYLDAMREEVVKMAAYGQNYSYLDKRANVINNALKSGLRKTKIGLTGAGFFSGAPTYVGRSFGSYFSGVPDALVGGAAGGALTGGMYGGITGAIRDDSDFWTGAGRGALSGAGLGATGTFAIPAALKFLPKKLSANYFPGVFSALGYGAAAANIAAASPLGDRVFGPAQDPWYTRQGIQDRLSAYYGTNPYLY